MLFKDCAKADLFKSGDLASVKKPDAGKMFIAGWVAATTPAYDLTRPASHAIRGPPPDWPELSRTRPSILQITQRLRE